VLNMSFTRVLATLAFSLAVLADGLAWAAEDGKRLALIIGNDAYSIRPLRNAVNDARAMDKALQAAGFRTILVENATKVAMEKYVPQFLRGIGPDDTALFFYAGHAFQYQGENVLIPVDFEPTGNAIDARFRSFSLAQLFDHLKLSRPKRAILIIDACRSNPVAEGTSLQAGLAMPQNPGREWYVAYSTSPNRVATDNPNGKNSYFTEALSDLVTQPGLTIDDVFTRVREKVETATKGAQTPWSQTSLTAKFHFIAPKEAEKVTDASLTKKWLDEGLRYEQQGEWQEAIDLFERVVNEEKDGPIRSRASARLPYASARRDAQTLFEQRKYSEAGTKLIEACKLEPFGFSAAIEAADSFLLAEDFDGAANVLAEVRKRAASEGVKIATAMLTEIAPINTIAAAELKRGVPEPPSIRELFASHRVGVPDFASGQAYSRQAQPVEYAKFVPQFPAPAVPKPVALASAQDQAQSGNTSASVAPASPGATASGEAQSPIDLETLHAELHSISGSRDLVEEVLVDVQVGKAKSPMALLVDGKPVARELPYKAHLAPGKYRLTLVEHGKRVREQEIEVKNGEPKIVDVDQ